MTNLSRRGFIGSSGLMLVGAAAVTGRSAFAAVPEAPTMKEAATQAPLVPTSGPDYQPVATLNGWTLPWRRNGDWKEFHLVAEPVEREMAPGMKAYLWGYNGQSPGPTIEAVEGDKVRIFVTNKLPEHTTIHWHGQRLPNGMDGVGGLNQPHIPPGKTFVYEFQLRRSGTYMYHPHSDEMVQMAMGMMGFFVVHPKDPAFRRVDRDFVFLLNAFDIEPGSYVPRVAEMTNFNMWCWNSRVFPGIDPFVVAKNDKVRIRFGNLTMTNHPIHMHGYEFKVSCTDGGWVDPAAAWDEVSIDVAVGQMRAFDFVADELGDWAIHCHKSHHTMNAMGHSVKNYIGVNKKDLAKRIAKIAPGYMPMGSNGMGEMGSMEMPLPENTLPMMTGFAQFGAVEMGGMFSVVKVREGLAKNDYKDPGWFKHPEGTVAYELKGQKLGEAPRAAPVDSGVKSAEWRAKDPRKPSLGPDGKPRPAAKGGHSNH
ncbi:exported copper oxidase [Camelimonas fluminis]|uniref:Multicopper oxidase family protein n=1 Tax=Camelimonas fluminis TaxID=1576911 RepID=A0ABV7UMA6_9HYPH|nr:copper oxidase [Camelimonas fluminis]GHE77128.1 exported copper oxidase [Camelimonas fluminis]